MWLWYSPQEEGSEGVTWRGAIGLNIRSDGRTNYCTHAWGWDGHNCIAKNEQGEYVLYDWPGEKVLGVVKTLKAAQVTAAILNERN